MSQDQYFGTKELYQLTLRANSSMCLGARNIDVHEPVFYFNRAQMTNLYQNERTVTAHGGWGDMPLIVWEDKEELSFTITEGVMNKSSFGFLLGAQVMVGGTNSTIMVPRREGPFSLDGFNNYFLDHVIAANQPHFMYEYSNDCIQSKVIPTITGDQLIHVNNPTANATYVMDYYYSYGESTTSYIVDQRTFNNSDFYLEGKFYTKDENEGENITNLLIMPRVRVVSNINLHLGERTDPTTSVFKLIAMPSRTDVSSYELMRIVRLDGDVDAE